MIKFEKTEVVGWEAAIRGMRNPMNSWKKSDTLFFEEGTYYDINGNSGVYNGDEESIDLGINDLDLMQKLATGGPVHAKYRRMITVYVDINAPLYWWKEFDTYKVGTVANSCSTMHKIHDKEFTMEDFSCEHLTSESKEVLKNVMCLLNDARDCYLKHDHMKEKDENYFVSEITCKKDLWWQMIQLLPSSYNQKRTIMLNYEVLAGIYPMRKDHKLDEWHDFCKWIKSLPYGEIIIRD